MKIQSKVTLTIQAEKIQEGVTLPLYEKYLKIEYLQFDFPIQLGQPRTMLNISVNSIVIRNFLCINWQPVLLLWVMLLELTHFLLQYQ